MAKTSTPIVHALRLYCEAERAIDNVLHATGFKRRYYSQKGQDRWLIERVFGKFSSGYFVEVGAGDGRTHSNTYVLERDYGWTGVLIDANPKYLEAIRRNRCCISLCACADSESRDVEFFDFGYLGGIVADDTDYSRQKRDALLRKQSKKLFHTRSQSLGNILDSIGAPKQIQYLSIDVEGAELRILNGFPFDRYVFDALTIERPTRAIHACLTDAGYVLDKTKWCDGFYLARGTAARLGIKPKPFSGMPSKFF
jgi:FkbM family methyltransferase